MIQIADKVSVVDSVLIVSFQYFSALDLLFQQDVCCEKQTGKQKDTPDHSDHLANKTKLSSSKNLY